MAQQSNPQPNRSGDGGGEPPSKGYEKVIANWTRILGASTIALVIATFIGAYFLYETDQTIKKQLGAAQMQLRAYIGFQQLYYAPRIRREPNQADVFLGSDIGLTWRDFGVTPAKEFEQWISARWYGAGTEPDFSRPVERISDRVTMTLGGSVEIPATVYVSPEDIRRANAGDGRVFFWGHATYRDVFPDTPPRHFHFCMVMARMPEIQNVPATFSVYKPECNYSD